MSINRQIENISNHVMVSHGSEFNELCQPILKTTPINYIGFARIYENGERSYLITNPAWGEVLLKNKYHLAGTEDALIHGVQSSHQLWAASQMFELNQQTQNLFQDCVANNYGNGVTLIERGNNFVEFIHMCSDSGHEAINPYLAHNIDQLWRYVLYLRESIQDNTSLRLAYQRKYQYDACISVRKGAVITCQNDSVGDIKKYYLGGRFDGIYFTKPEMECLLLLVKNKAAKEQAAMFHLSHRTIEHRIERIKIKARCKNITELVLALMDNKAFKSLVFNTPFV